MTDDLEKLAQAWVDAKSSVSFAAGSRSANPSLDPDGRIVEMAIDELREARTAFLTAAAQAERETAELRAEVERLREEIASRRKAQDRSNKAMTQFSLEHDALRADAAKVLRPFARLKIPFKPQGNAGAYSLFHEHIRAAAALLAKLDAGEAGRTDGEAICRD
jgi:FtsZ-binding cell division protein ZapB